MPRHLPLTGVLALAAVAAGASPLPAAARPCPPDLRGGVALSVDNRRGGDAPTRVHLSGRRLNGPCVPAHAATTYDVALELPAGCAADAAAGAGLGSACTCAAGVVRCAHVLDDLAAGEWLHRIEVEASGQRQARRGLVMADAAAPATVQWTAYRTVATVRSGADDSAPDTLRGAVAAAAAAPPALIQFAPGDDGSLLVRLTDPAPLRITSEMVIDGTDAAGDPSPVAPFDARRYRAVIELAPRDPALPHAAAIRVAAADSGLRGVYVRRILGPDASIARRDQDLVAFDAGARRGFVDTARLDGGSAHRAAQSCPANDREAARNPAQGKDCVDVDSTGYGDMADAVVISNSELRHCYDRAVKSRDAATVVRRSWIHRNARGGLLAQSPRGRLASEDNLIEGNGRNCPSASRCDGGPRAGQPCCPWGVAGDSCGGAPAIACPGAADAGCGSGLCRPLDVAPAGCETTATRAAAAQLSAEPHATTLLRSRGDVVRDAERRGIFLRNGAAGMLQDDFICGHEFGMELAADAGRGAPIGVVGVASVLNRRAGVLLNQQDGRLAEVSFGTASIPGRNAFSHNGGGAAGGNFNMGRGGAPRSAIGNQWQHGGDGARCRATQVTRRDVATANANLAVTPCESPRRPSGGTAVLSTRPPAALAGAVVHIGGRGFNAIDGYGRGGATSCRELSAGNTCAPVRGTCVEFEDVDGSWKPAAAVLGVTPTQLVVRSPIDCVKPRRVRVRHLNAAGRAETATSATAIFCRNE